MQATDAFSYQCTRCGQCCRDKRIQLNPYEIARLARHRGMTTSEFRDAHTHEGAYLRQRDDGRCVFFDAQTGCSVHTDRPLVCRLFPLGRTITASGAVSYARGVYEPPPNGRFDDDGTVDDFLDAQGARPFIAAADAYFRWYVDITDEDTETTFEGDDRDDLLDIDSMLSASDDPAPEDIEARTLRHLQILNGFILKRGREHDPIV